MACVVMACMAIACTAMAGSESLAGKISNAAKEIIVADKNGFTAGQCSPHSPAATHPLPAAPAHMSIHVLAHMLAHMLAHAYTHVLTHACTHACMHACAHICKMYECLYLRLMHVHT